MSANQGVKPTIAKLPAIEARRAKAEWPFDVGLVPLRDCIVDDTYQRPPAHEFISRIAANFDETLVGTIDVSHRKGDIYAILDGQQRFLAMTQVGKTACFCSIYTGMTIQDEAGFFYRKNRDRKNMPAYYAFRARMAAGDTEAQVISTIVEEAGYKLGPTTNEEDVIGAIRAVEIAYSYQAEHRDNCLYPSLMLIRKAFHKRKGSMDSGIIQGLGRFYQTYADAEINKAALETALRDLGPTMFLGMARDLVATGPKSTKGGLSIPWAVARKAVDLHNKALGGNRKGRLNPRLLGGGAA